MGTTFYCRLRNENGVEYGPEWECELECEYYPETDAFFVHNISHWETTTRLHDLSGGDDLEKRNALNIEEQAYEAFESDRDFRCRVLDDLGIRYVGRGGTDPDARLERAFA